MALTLWQRLRVAFRGWSRRREEESRRREQEFLARNTSWAKPSPVVPQQAARPSDAIDIEGLQVAYLDESGRIDYYFDVQAGEVVEVRDKRALAADRYKRVPQRSAAGDAEDRRAFAATVEDARMQQALAAAIEPQDFRRLVASDRGVERAWYNFKNDRATKAIEAWLRIIGLRPKA